MIINEHTVIVGEKVVLVPYRPEHVPKYHEWMCDEELRALTASEPLSLDEEYQMQQQWLVDDDKLTFIVLARDGNLPEITKTNLSVLPDLSLDNDNDNVLSPSDPRITSLPMIGDVNIFLKGTIPSLANHLEWQRPTQSNDEDDPFEAEVEIMIAEPTYRRRGYASEVLQLMLAYATGAPVTYFGGRPSPRPGVAPSALQVPPAALVTRISESNTPSILLFQKLGFRVTKRVEVFGEVEMRWFASNS